MRQPKIARPHGGVRGANLSRSSVLFQGAFGRMFRALPPADYPDDGSTLANLEILGAAMCADPDPEKDGPDAEESGIPSAYTYLGQFIDHDLTFDPASSLQKQNDPDALVDYRTPRFDLDNVYGRGPDDQPYMYEDGRTFLRGKPLTGAGLNAGATDLPRSAGSRPRAIIGDPRNDENIIISQLQGLFHRFHNKIANDNPNWDFARVQKEVRFHYQWMVLHDFLPAVVSEKVLHEVLPKGQHTLGLDDIKLKYYHPREEAFMPLEFSAAAYRFGHSMVRPGYRLSDTQGPLPIFSMSKPDMRGFQPPPGNAALDWRRFIDLELLQYGTPGDPPDPTDPRNINRLQLAYRIDTSLVNPLASLPATIAVNPPNLAQRNLERGWRMRLPSGQDIARAMGLVPQAEILIGKFTGSDPLVNIDTIAGGAFQDNCPLWTYTLAETVESTVVVKTLQGDQPIKTRKLGPVGGRIVAETFVGILTADSSSFLSQNPLWRPPLAGADGGFGLREFVKHALLG